MPLNSFIRVISSYLLPSLVRDLIIHTNVHVIYKIFLDNTIMFSHSTVFSAMLCYAAFVLLIWRIKIKIDVTFVLIAF